MLKTAQNTAYITILSRFNTRHFVYKTVQMMLCVSYDKLPYNVMHLFPLMRTTMPGTACTCVYSHMDFNRTICLKRGKEIAVVLYSCFIVCRRSKFSNVNKYLFSLWHRVCYVQYKYFVVRLKLAYCTWIYRNAMFDKRWVLSFDPSCFIIYSCYIVLLDSCKFKV